MREWEAARVESRGTYRSREEALTTPVGDSRLGPLFEYKESLVFSRDGQVPHSNQVELPQEELA